MSVMIIFRILCFNLVGHRPQLNGCCHQGEGRGLVFQSKKHFDQHDEDGGSDQCDKCGKVWQALVFQSEMHYDQHDGDLVALIVVKISKVWHLWSLSFDLFSEVLPEHHRDPRAKREASQNPGSSPAVVRFCDSTQNSHSS